MGLSFVTVAKPFSQYGKDSAYNDPLIFNRDFFFAFSFSKLISFFVGKEKYSKIRCFYEKKVWTRIIREIEPSSVIAIQPSAGLCSAGKSLGVKVYDYQHGIISDDHLWYGRALQKMSSEDELPSGILFWDEASKEVLSDFGKARNVELSVLGNPWFERFMMRDEKDELVKDCACNDNECSSLKPTILVSLQWGLKQHYYQDVEFNGLMCGALVNVIRETEGLYNWKLRLHPVQIHSGNREVTIGLLETLFGDCSGVEWDLSTRLPLPVLLNNVDLHITDMSTVVVEAAWFGVPSAILNPYVRKGERLGDTFLAQRERGIATVINQVESEIKVWITDNLSGKSERNVDKRLGGLERFLISHKDRHRKC